MAGQLGDSSRYLVLRQSFGKRGTRFNSFVPVQKEHHALTWKYACAAIKVAYLTAGEVALVGLSNSDSWLISRLIGTNHRRRNRYNRTEEYVRGALVHASSPVKRIGFNLAAGAVLSGNGTRKD